MDNRDNGIVGPILTRAAEKATEKALEAAMNGRSMSDDEILWTIMDHALDVDPEDYPPPQGGVDPATGTVCIVGKGRTRVLAPWGEPDYEFWGLNDPMWRKGHPPLKSHDRWFQLHSPSYMEKHYPIGVRLLDERWSAPTGVKLYMDRHYPEYPDSVAYPKDEVEAMTSFGYYHTSSFDWMVALAILEGWSKIELYGTSFATFPAILDGEPLAARPCLEYWIGVAEGRGIEVTLCDEGNSCHLFKNVHVAVLASDLRYGFEREPALDLGTDGEDEWRDVR